VPIDALTLRRLNQRYSKPWQAGALAARIAEIEAAERDFEAMRCIGTRLAEQAAVEAQEAAAAAVLARREAAQAALGHDPLAIGLFTLLAQSAGSWRGTVAGLLDQLAGSSITLSCLNPIWFARRLRHRRHTLLQHGIRVTLRHDGRQRLVIIQLISPGALEIAYALAD
jgi:hypothetical protein